MVGTRPKANSDVGKQSASIEWPAFVGYCICTAGTVHVHGAHYKGGREGEVFSASADFLSREMQQLSELRYAWSSVQHQRETLQTIYGCHSELVKSLASNPMRYSPVFHLEDFFDRYSDLGQFFDGAHISFADILVDPAQEAYSGHGLYAHRASNASVTSNSNDGSNGISSKRKQSSTSASRKKHLDLKLSHRNSHPENSLMSPNGTMSEDHRSHLSDQNLSMQQQMLDPMTPNVFHPHANTSTPNTSNPNNTNGTMPSLSQTPFSPPYAFSSLNQPESYDPMFGMSQMGFSYGMNGATPGVMNGATPNGMNGNGNGGGNGMQQEGMTPGARSNGESTGTGGTEGEKDPFLSLLEQLAENEHSRGGPSELDFFLSGGNG